MDYKDSQKQKVENLIKNTAYFYDDTGNGNYNVNVTHPYLLKNAENNLYQSIRAQVFKYFSENKIAWWGGKLTNNTLSSQVACLNHLFPIRHDKNAVLSIMKKIKSDLVDVFPITTDKSDPAYIQFEAVSDKNHLNEKSSTRGSNCTSIDALIYGKLEDDKRIIFPIEWKYVESYSNEDKSKGDSGNVRKSSYTCLINNSTQLQHNTHDI